MFITCDARINAFPSVWLTVLHLVDFDENIFKYYVVVVYSHYYRIDCSRLLRLL